MNLVDADSVGQLADLVTRIEDSDAVTVVVFDSANPDYFGLAGFVDCFAAYRRVRQDGGRGHQGAAGLGLLPPDEEFGPALAALFRTCGRPGNAARVRYLFDNGLQTPVGVELDLGRAVAEFASSLDPWLR